MKKKFLVNYNDIIAVDNLLAAWREFIVGKKSKPDVLDFSLHLMDNILQLNGEFANRTYRHGGYKSFYITDPKLRHIHKAGVRDRLVHHAIYRQLYPFFAKVFIADSTKLKRSINWEPRITAREGVEKSIEWNLQLV